MARARKKLRERQASRFSRGPTASLLFGIGGILMAFALGGGYFLAAGLRATGIADLGDDAARVVGGVLAMLFVIPATFIAQRHQQQLQVVRDQDIRVGGPVALYLRPFFIDKYLRLPNPYRSRSFWSPDMAPILPAEFIGRVLEPYINVRQLGGGPETLANTRVQAPLLGDEWKRTVKNQIQAASVAIVIPLLDRDRKSGELRGQATLWELAWLINSGAMARTIVMMPSVAWVHRRRVRDGWERGRAVLRELGLVLPPYTKRGEVMTFARDDGCWCVAASFGGKGRAINRFAVGLVEAVQSLAGQHGFALLDR
jgi:hypothetical protein